MYGSYLIEGPYGSGKTSLARIFSQRLLCESSELSESEEVNPCGKCSACVAFEKGANPNYREVDAATYSGVDSVRELQKFARSGALSGSGYKVIVVDEAHDLSRQAQDVLLKTLEEARQGLVFILCTTAEDQVLGTIHSRSVLCRVTIPSLDQVLERLKWIANQEDIDIEDNALRLIVVQTHLHLRDAIKEMEVLSVTRTGTITHAAVADHYGLGSYQEVLQFLCSLASKPLEAVDLAYRISSLRGVLHFYRLVRLILADVLAIKTRHSDVAKVLDPEGDRAAINTISSSLGRKMILLAQFVIESTNRQLDWETLFADVLYMNAIVTQDIVFRQTAQASVAAVSFERQCDAEEMNRLLSDPQKLYQAGKLKKVKSDTEKAKPFDELSSEGDFIEDLWNDVDELDNESENIPLGGDEPSPPPPAPDSEVGAAIDAAFGVEESSNSREGGTAPSAPSPPEDDSPPPPPLSDNFDPSNPFSGCFD